MKRLLTALVSATLLATFFAGTPAPTFASSTEDYYIGYGSGTDTGCGSPDFYVNGRYSRSANNDRIEDNIQAALDVVDDGDTIIICAGWYTLHGDMPLWDGDLDDGAGVNPINITIRGAGVGDTVISGAFGYYNAFAFGSTNLTLEDMTIFTTDHQMGGGDYQGGAVEMQNGDLTVNNVEFNNYGVDYSNGGAIAIENGDLAITDSFFDQTSGTSFWWAVRGDGGAIWSYHTNPEPSTISITGTEFNNNHSSGQGGAIWAYCADATITDSSFYDNTTGSKGGAIAAISDGDCTGALTIDQSTFEGNYVPRAHYLGGGGSQGGAHMGGAIFSVGQDMTVTDSSFGADAPGAANYANNGGAIAMRDNTTGTATLTVSNSDFEDNYANINGGALWLACVDATITGDSAGTFDSYLEGSSSNFFSNHARNLGGAIYMYANNNSSCDYASADLTIDGVVFDWNFARNGGAIANRQTSTDIDGLEVSNSVFSDNKAKFDGGAINTDDINVSVDQSGFFGNISQKGSGGAMELSGNGQTITVTDSVLENNNTDNNHDNYGDGGGAIAARYVDVLNVDGSTFNHNGNKGSEGGGAILRQGYGDDTISNSAFYDNSTGRMTDCCDNEGVDSNGGAIMTDATTGIYNSSFEDNTTGVDGYGGAISQDDGTLTISGSNFWSNYSWYNGGAVNTEGWGLTVTNSDFTYNTSRTDNGGAIATDFDGVRCPTDTCLTITGSTFEWNRSQNGGAVATYDSALINNSSFTNNVAWDEGGAIELGNMQVTIQNSDFKNNGALFGNGGAVYFDGATANSKLVVTGSSFTDNSAGSGYNASEHYSGAIHSDDSDSTLRVAGSTFNGNTSNNSAGAIFSAGPLVLSGSVLSRNTAPYEGGAVIPAVEFTIESNTFRNNSADWGGAVSSYHATGNSILSRNLFDANSASYGGAVYLYSYGIASTANQMAIHTNRFWNNVARVDGGGIFIDFSNAGATYSLANNMKSNMFVRNRARFGAAGVNLLTSVSKSAQRLFASLTKSNKYQLNKSTVRGADKLTLQALADAWSLPALVRSTYAPVVRVPESNDPVAE
jgi:predicted outer membrane repeat protein